MKKIVEVTEVKSEGLEALLGQEVLLFCLNYIYTGTLAGVDHTFVLLQNPSIVYETGAYTEKGYADSQKLHTDKWYVQRSAIESFGVGK
jgi:hypothetical protein